MAQRFNISTPRKKKDGGTYWVKIGTAWQNEKGIQLVFDALPLPDAEGRCVANLFEPREDNRSGARDRRDAQDRAGSQPAITDDGADPDFVPF
jgi:hypothetical protein